MINYEKYTELLQWHRGVELFDYNLAIDWAIHMLDNDIETENILIIASFSKPVDREEIKPYISGVLQDLNLEEKHGHYSIITYTHYCLEQILVNYELRKNLRVLYNLCLEVDHRSGLNTFYLLYHAWWSLEEDGCNYYFEGADLHNIESVLKSEARNWIDEYIHGIK